MADTDLLIPIALVLILAVMGGGGSSSPVPDPNAWSETGELQFGGLGHGSPQMHGKSSIQEEGGYYMKIPSGFMSEMEPDYRDVAQSSVQSRKQLFENVVQYSLELSEAITIYNRQKNRKHATELREMIQTNEHFTHEATQNYAKEVEGFKRITQHMNHNEMPFYERALEDIDRQFQSELRRVLENNKSAIDQVKEFYDTREDTHNVFEADFSDAPSTFSQVQSFPVPASAPREDKGNPFKLRPERIQAFDNPADNISESVPDVPDPPSYITKPKSKLPPKYASSFQSHKPLGTVREAPSKTDSPELQRLVKNMNSRYPEIELKDVPPFDMSRADRDMGEDTQSVGGLTAAMDALSQHGRDLEQGRLLSPQTPRQAPPSGEGPRTPQPGASSKVPFQSAPPATPTSKKTLNEMFNAPWRAPPQSAPRGTPKTPTGIPASAYEKFKTMLDLIKSGIAGAEKIKNAGRVQAYKNQIHELVPRGFPKGSWHDLADGSTSAIKLRGETYDAKSLNRNSAYRKYVDVLRQVDEIARNYE